MSDTEGDSDFFTDSDSSDDEYLIAEPKIRNSNYLGKVTFDQNFLLLTY